MSRRPVRVGVDTGGTFTDVVVDDGRRIRIGKVLSTPSNPAEAVLRGVRHLVPRGTPLELTYGSTVATNTLLERRGARLLLFTTSGFEDVIEIGRQTRPELYALEPVRPEPLVSRASRIGVAERIGFDGSVLRPLTQHAVREAIALARRRGPDATVVCFLHSYANSGHERRLAAALRRAGFPCSASHELCAQRREYERFSTAVINAYVAPKMSHHLAELSRAFRGSVFRVMQSNGGAIAARTAAREAVRTILSGPAGGVVGAVDLARRMGIHRLITFDMGGTSTDVSLVDDEPIRRTECLIGGLPTQVPTLDVHTVGAGGGSIAYRDLGGVLKVGPQSAGAVPGPACYGRGDRPTVTDANLLLGRLGDGVLAGDLRLDQTRARRAIGRLARELRLGEDETAEGIVKVINVAMERAIRAVSVERGHDPRDYALVAFGGAAGLHACELAASLGVRTVLIPRSPGVLSAWGAANADVIRDYLQTLRAMTPTLANLRRAESGLRSRARREMAAEGIRRVTWRSLVAVRYAGQSFHVEVPLERGYRQRFHAAHERLYGYADRSRPIEVVHVALQAIGRRKRLALPVAEPTHEPPETIRVRSRSGWARGHLFRRESLAARANVRGPAVIAELSATTYVPAGWQATVDYLGNLCLSHAR